MKWLADENFDNDILRGINRRRADFDVVRAQDIESTSGLDDQALLSWATANDRVVLTHDLSTMIPAMREQTKLFGRCAPVLFVRDSLPISIVIEEIILLNECSIETDWAAGVVYLPLD